MVVIKTRDRGGDDLFVVLIWEDCTMGKDGKKEKMGFRKFCFLVRSERRATAHRFLLEFFLPERYLKILFSTTPRALFSSTSTVVEKGHLHFIGF